MKCHAYILQTHAHTLQMAIWTTQYEDNTDSLMNVENRIVKSDDCDMDNTDATISMKQNRIVRT